MRLRKLFVKGYRSIQSEATSVTDDRVTILIGANDHGKSNLLSAILCLNEDQKITADDRNWDLEEDAPVEIRWYFTVTEKTLERLKQLSPPPQLEKPASPDVPLAEDAGGGPAGRRSHPNPLPLRPQTKSLTSRPQHFLSARRRKLSFLETSPQTK